MKKKDFFIRAFSNISRPPTIVSAASAALRRVRPRIRRQNHRQKTSAKKSKQSRPLWDQTGSTVSAICHLPPKITRQKSQNSSDLVGTNSGNYIPPKKNQKFSKKIHIFTSESSPKKKNSSINIFHVSQQGSIINRSLLQK